MLNCQQLHNTLYLAAIDPSIITVIIIIP